MTTWHPEGGHGEVLDLGGRTRPGTLLRVAGTALVCLVLGGLAGARIDDAFERRAAREAAPVLAAGVIQEHPDPEGERRFAVPLHNGGPITVTVDSATADGWLGRDAEPAAVAIPPGGWVMLPLRTRIDCAALGTTAPTRLTVRTTTPGGSLEQELAMPAPSRALDAEGARLCVAPSGSVPSRQEALGTWYVEEAGADRGTLLRLRADGTFAIDPDLFRFGPALDALGTFVGSGGLLRVTARGGHDCRAGDRTRWRITLLEDGRLHIRHEPVRARWCGIEAGEVWIARRA